MAVFFLARPRNIRLRKLSLHGLVNTNSKHRLRAKVEGFDSWLSVVYVAFSTSSWHWAPPVMPSLARGEDATWREALLASSAHFLEKAPCIDPPVCDLRGGCQRATRRRGRGAVGSRRSGLAPKKTVKYPMKGIELEVMLCLTITIC